MTEISGTRIYWIIQQRKASNIGIISLFRHFLVWNSKIGVCNSKPTTNGTGCLFVHIPAAPTCMPSPRSIAIGKDIIVAEVCNRYRAVANKFLPCADESDNLFALGSPNNNAVAKPPDQCQCSGGTTVATLKFSASNRNRRTPKSDDASGNCLFVGICERFR